MNIFTKSFNRRTILKAGVTSALSSIIAPALGAAGEFKMLTRTIHSTGQKIGLIAYGGSPAFRGNNANDPVLAQELIAILINAGGSYIDANRNAPQKLAKFITPADLAKLDLAISSSGADVLKGAEYLKGLQTSLNKSPISFVQSRFSNPNKDASNFAAMQKWKEQGLVRHIGFSGLNNFDHIEYLIKQLKPDYVQFNYSLFEPDAEQRLLPLAADQGVAVVVNRPFMNGRYFSTVKDLKLPEWAADFDCHSWAQFSLKFIAAHPAVTTVLTETSKPRHARDNVAAGIGRLPNKAEREKMRQLIGSI